MRRTLPAHLEQVSMLMRSWWVCETMHIVTSPGEIVACLVASGLGLLPHHHEESRGLEAAELEKVLALA